MKITVLFFCIHIQDKSCHMSHVHNIMRRTLRVLKVHVDVGD